MMIGAEAHGIHEGTSDYVVSGTHTSIGAGFQSRETFTTHPNVILSTNLVLLVAQFCMLAKFFE
jgi:hypothetical protein